MVVARRPRVGYCSWARTASAGQAPGGKVASGGKAALGIK